jgi:DNA (cytosine-5)-methyltransferase 1
MIAIDLFAGAGGFSEGARMAGVSVAWAANHWAEAVRWHACNHPGATHACQDLQQADFRDAPPHDVLLASPACQGHSRARGTDRPHHDAQRSTAWAVVTCAEVHRPPVVVVENVPEFADWTLYPRLVRRPACAGLCGGPADPGRRRPWCAPAPATPFRRGPRSPDTPSS